MALIRKHSVSLIIKHFSLRATNLENVWVKSVLNFSPTDVTDESSKTWLFSAEKNWTYFSLSLV